LGLCLVLASGVPVADAYSKLTTGASYRVLAYAIPVLATVVGGYTSAAHSKAQPYLNASIAGILVIAWYLIMLTNPLQLMRFEAIYIVAWLLIPVPAALLGAHVWRWRSAGGKA
jgi:hypothetical protein